MKARISDDIARAAARDEADRQMQKAGRSTWNDDDWNCAVRTYNAIWYGKATCSADRQAQSK